MRLQRFQKCAAMTFGVGIALGAGPVWAQDAKEGRYLYERYCAACHGDDGTGDGPLRPVLTITPTDLTALSRENSGDFPLERVVSRIDGRDPVEAHGGPMPVFGHAFDGEAPIVLQTLTGEMISTSKPLADLTAYLAMIQAD